MSLKSSDQAWLISDRRHKGIRSIRTQKDLSKMKGLPDDMHLIELVQ